MPQKLHDERLSDFFGATYHHSSFRTGECRRRYFLLQISHQSPHVHVLRSLRPIHLHLGTGRLH